MYIYTALTPRNTDVWKPKDVLGATRPLSVDAHGRALVIWDATPRVLPVSSAATSSTSATTPAGSNAAVACADAHCPHLGAHLGGDVGGTVSGEGFLRCPFHGFEFDAAGGCVKAYHNRSCEAARLATHPTRVKFGLVWVWLGDQTSESAAIGAKGHSDDCDRRAPSFDLIDLASFPELLAADIDAAAPRHSCVHTVAAHLRDIPENAADTAHLHALHAPGFTPWLSHVWEFEWVGPAAKKVADSHGSDDKVVWGEALGPDVCRAQFVVRTLVHLPFGLGAIEAAAMEGRVRQCGPGALTVIELRLPPWLRPLCGAGVAAVQSVTPLAPLRQLVRHRLHCPRRMPRALSWAVHSMLREQVRANKRVDLWGKWDQDVRAKTIRASSTKAFEYVPGSIKHGSPSRAVWGGSCAGSAYAGAGPAPLSWCSPETWGVAEAVSSSP